MTQLNMFGVDAQSQAAAVNESIRGNMMAKLMSLDAWAESIFGENKPHRNTLLNWRRNGRIVPPPIKCGGRYFVEPSAVYCDDAGEMYRRLGNGRSS